MDSCSTSAGTPIIRVADPPSFVLQIQKHAHKSQCARKDASHAGDRQHRRQVLLRHSRTDVGRHLLMPLLSLLQLQKDGEWAKWVDLAFSKLDTNDDGYIDLEELIAQLPGMGVGVDERQDSERLLAVSAQGRGLPCLAK